MNDLHNTQNFTNFQSFALNTSLLKEVIGGGGDKIIYQKIIGDEIFIKERIDGDKSSYCIPVGSTQIL